VSEEARARVRSLILTGDLIRGLLERRSADTRVLEVEP
jgi:hypothetical protein